MADFLDDRILRGDTSIFTIITALSQSDRAVFLELQNIVGSLYPGYCYLEVGSDRGGSIIAPLFDSRCGALVSVDPRPEVQPDERGVNVRHADNTTAKMLETLAAAGVSQRAFSRLRVFEADLGKLPFWRIGTRARLAFIDAEHTNQAVFRDWLNVWRCMEPAGIVCFHDSNLVFDALENIRAMLRHQDVHFSAYYLPDTMFVVALGAMAEEVTRAFAARSLDPARFLATARAELNATIVRNIASGR